MNVLVTLNYNDAETTISFVDLIKDYSVLDKIIVVDNMSTDDSYEKLTALKSDCIDVIRSDENGGYARGNNFGVRYAAQHYDPEIVFISNPDVVFDEHAASEMINEIRRYDDLAWVSPVMHDRNGKIPSTYANELPNTADLFCSTFFGLKWLRIKTKKKSDYKGGDDNELLYTGFVSGSFFAIEYKAFEEVGLFDERTFLYGEEKILGHKLREKGYKTAVLLNESYIHMHGVSIKKSIKKKKQTDRLMENGNVIYLEMLGAGKTKISLYKFLNRIGFYERSVVRKFRSKD